MPRTASSEVAISTEVAVTSQIDMLRDLAAHNVVISQRHVVDGLLDLWNASDRPPVRAALERSLGRFARRSLVESGELTNELDLIWAAQQVEHAFDDYVLEC